MSRDRFAKQGQRSSGNAAHDLEFRLSQPDRYRSRGEYRIAQLLSQCGLPFAYEKPVAVRDGDKTKIWHPDFYLSCGVYIEYFGINGEQSYRDRTRHKLNVYARNGINVIAVYPSDLADSRWEQRLLGRIDKSLERILQTYRLRIARSGGDDPYRPYLELR